MQIPVIRRGSIDRVLPIPDIQIFICMYDGLRGAGTVSTTTCTVIRECDTRPNSPRPYTPTPLRAQPSGMFRNVPSSSHRSCATINRFQTPIRKSTPDHTSTQPRPRPPGPPSSSLPTRSPCTFRARTILHPECKDLPCAATAHTRRASPSRPLAPPTPFFYPGLLLHTSDPDLDADGAERPHDNTGIMQIHARPVVRTRTTAHTRTPSGVPPSLASRSDTPESAHLFGSCCVPRKGKKKQKGRVPFVLPARHALDAVVVTATATRDGDEMGNSGRGRNGTEPWRLGSEGDTARRWRVPAVTAQRTRDRASCVVHVSVNLGA